MIVCQKKGKYRMEIVINKYRIVSSDKEYTIKKPKGKQWARISGHSTLEEAINDLFNYRVKTELKDFVINFNDAVNLEAQKAAFFTKIAKIKNEILEALK